MEGNQDIFNISLCELWNNPPANGFKLTERIRAIRIDYSGSTSSPTAFTARLPGSTTITMSALLNIKPNSFHKPL